MVDIFDYTLQPGMTLYKNGASMGLTITGYATGNGGIGSYILSAPLNLACGNNIVPAFFTSSKFGGSGWHSMKVYNSSGTEYLTNLS